MKLLRELLNPEHAGADLCLLREVAPQSDLLKSPLVKAARQAEKILYTLLDHTTAERIRLNRRRPEEEEKKSEVVPEPLPVPEPALPNDKKKTNTRPSTGKTSSTVTSK